MCKYLSTDVNVVNMSTAYISVCVRAHSCASIIYLCWQMTFVLSCKFKLVVNVCNGKTVLKEALAMSVFHYLQDGSAVGWVVIDKLDEGQCPRCTVCL